MTARSAKSYCNHLGCILSHYRLSKFSGHCLASQDYGQNIGSSLGNNRRVVEKMKFMVMHQYQLSDINLGIEKYVLIYENSFGILNI